ncbi:hypothetical protein Ppa06_59670 [Planomonospora parontospora subsp. parontospora]|uniref:Uncharacterized protein n=2 Tax=Planomonospora parontospora TaxID=58119 RepID=A0AA37BM42_9ACTN|nr:hypothetical protein [Planomonospora parontospora]GGK92077.1 hypothetical protein GCM10010126_59280 [Planomonospora parontospora]GII12169.1 hypothetical protein Ppa06_59670 [Planomonospora parontospora subsp. parontospora]
MPLPVGRQRVTLEFVERTLPSQALDLVVDQLPLVYAEWLIRKGTEWLIERWLGSASVVEPVGRWLPYDRTTAMGAELARLARGATAPPVSSRPPPIPGSRRFWPPTATAHPIGRSTWACRASPTTRPT